MQLWTVPDPTDKNGDGQVEFAVLVTCPTNQNPNLEHWLIDSSSMVHMSNSHVGMTNWQKSSETIIVGSGIEFRAHHKSDIQLQVGNATLTLKGVLYIPKFSKNIISTSRIIKKGNTLHMGVYGVTLESESGGLLHLAHDFKTGMMYLNGKPLYPKEACPSKTQGGPKDKPQGKDIEAFGH